MGLEDTPDDDGADDDPWFYSPGGAWGYRVAWPVSVEGVVLVLAFLAAAYMSYVAIRAGWISPVLLIALEVLPAYLVLALAWRHTEFDD
jgi:hypothetical protein